jgi:hypothetical protein
MRSRASSFELQSFSPISSILKTPQQGADIFSDDNGDHHQLTDMSVEEGETIEMEDDLFGRLKHVFPF